MSSSTARSPSRAARPKSSTTTSSCANSIWGCDPHPTHKTATCRGREFLSLMRIGQSIRVGRRGTMASWRKTITLLPSLFAGLALGGLIAAPARAVEPITIGFGMALTGGLAGAGKTALLGMQIWQDDVNAKGGLLGRPVKLVYYDDQSNPPTVPGIYTKLLDVDKV